MDGWIDELTNEQTKGKLTEEMSSLTVPSAKPDSQRLTQSVTTKKELTPDASPTTLFSPTQGIALAPQLSLARHY